MKERRIKYEKAEALEKKYEHFISEEEEDVKEKRNSILKKHNSICGRKYNKELLNIFYFIL